jgi:hypothetical protein
VPAKQFLCLQEYTPAAILWLFTGDRRYFKPDEDNVAADFFDLAPGDNEFLAVGKQVGKTPRTWYDNGKQTPGIDIKFYVVDVSHPLAGTDVDDFLTLKICNSCIHKSSPQSTACILQDMRLSGKYASDAQDK